MNNGELEKKEPKELTPEDIFKTFYILLKSVGGAFSFPAKLLDEIPDNEVLITSVYDDVNDRFLFHLKKKHKRGIIKPRKKLILPDEYKRG